MLKAQWLSFLGHSVSGVKCTGETSELYTAIGEEYAESTASREYQQESSASGSCEGDTVIGAIH